MSRDLDSPECPRLQPSRLQHAVCASLNGHAGAGCQSRHDKVFRRRTIPETVRRRHVRKHTMTTHTCSHRRLEVDAHGRRLCACAGPSARRTPRPAELCPCRPQPRSHQPRARELCAKNPATAWSTPGRWAFPFESPPLCLWNFFGGNQGEGGGRLFLSWKVRSLRFHLPRLCRLAVLLVGVSYVAPRAQ